MVNCTWLNTTMVPMIKITDTTPQDVEQIQEWLDADPWHRDEVRNDPNFMVTGQGLQSFCVQDEKGPVFFIRFDAEGELVRVAIQFPPESLVSRQRIALGLKYGAVSAVKIFGTKHGFKGAVFESVNPELIAFMNRFGFESAGNNDYVLRFEGQQDV